MPISTLARADPGETTSTSVWEVVLTLKPNHTEPIPIQSMTSKMSITGRAFDCFVNARK